MEFINLKAQYSYLKQEIDNNIQQVLDSTNFVMGSQVNEFEKKLAEYVGRKYAVSCASGTDALQLIYMAYGIGTGDAVFCPDMTFIASVEPACMLGATPIFCDIDPRTYNLCPESLERQIKAVIKQGTLRPKAIVAVDFIGNPADYTMISKIAYKYDLLLIEDAAQGMGASYHGEKCGSFGDVAATSFFPSKPLGCYGDGGAVFTNSEDVLTLLQSLRVHGKGQSKYDNIRIGLNSRLDTLQAAIMLPKLSRLEEEIQIRQSLAKKYTDSLSPYFVTPYIPEGVISSYAQYALLATSREQRDEIQARLRANGIPTITYYPHPMHTMKVFEGCFKGDETFQNTIDYANRTFSIPFSAYLSIEEQDEIIHILLSF